MGYVKTPAEVAAMRQMFAAPKFLLDGLRIEFETSMDFIRSVLPPCLEAPAKPLALASVGRWQSWACGEFDTACIYVAARHNGIDGYYNLTMLVSGDMPIAWGREVWGEAKKSAAMRLHRDGNDFYAFGERHGVRLIELEAELGPDQGAGESIGHSFEVKAHPSADGAGLEYDPVLIVLKAHTRYTTLRQGTGRLTLRSSAFDPCGTVPVVRTLGAVHVNGESDYSVEAAIPQKDRAAYIPYVYGRNFDDLAQYPIPARYRRKQALRRAGE